MSTTTDPSSEASPNELKRRQRAAWAAGDYVSVARHIADVGRRIVGHVDVRPGERVLDVACGVGNAAIPAAIAGAEVTGIDLTPEMLDQARAAATEAGVAVDWREGDAEDLPVGDATYDVVLSTFGCMFAPRHDLASRELVRVLRGSGRLGLCNWTPDGPMGGFFATVGAHLPAPPSYASPPPLWGSEDHVRRMFDRSGLRLEFAREVIDLRFGSVDEVVEFYATRFGPIVAARKALEPEGRWAALLDGLRAYFERNTERRSDGIVWPGEYLVVLGRKPEGAGD